MGRGPNGRGGVSAGLVEEHLLRCVSMFFFFQAEDGIRDLTVTGVQTCALPILLLWVLGDTGTVNLTDPAITNLAGIFLGPRLGWLVGIVAVLVFLASLSRARRQIGRAPV